MNKTVTINLAGIYFHIDEDAYLKLSHYLEAIKHSFTDSQGRSEIIADIEARIAELFSERIQHEKQVVSTQLVDTVITIMGQPEDYLVNDAIFEDEPQYKKHDTRPSKKLYRDTINSYIGGVSAGLGHYFGIEIIWVRLLWLLLAIGSGGTFIFIYLTFWILVPEAKTTAEKLTMKGDAVNISNIEKKIKDGFTNVSKKVKTIDFQKQSHKLKSSSQAFFDTIGNLFLFFLQIMAKCIGIVLIIIGISTLVASILAFFTAGVTDILHFSTLDFVDAINATGTPIWLISLASCFVIGVPSFFIFYLGLKIAVNHLKSIGSIAKFTLLGLWLIAILGLTTIGFKQATEYAFDAKMTLKEQLNITPSDTIMLSMTNYKKHNNHLYKRRNNFKIIEDEKGKSIITSNIRLIVRSTTDSLATIVIEKEASGSSYNTAKKRAEHINYKFDLNANELKLNAFLTTDIKHKFSQQKVLIVLYLPEGTTLYANKNTYYFHRNTPHYNDILDNGMEDRHLKIIKNDTECLDCIKNNSTKEKSTP